MAETAFTKHFTKGRRPKKTILRRERPGTSDDDPGYPWGRAGRRRNEMLQRKSGYLWAGYNPTD